MAGPSANLLPLLLFVLPLPAVYILNARASFEEIPLQDSDHHLARLALISATLILCAEFVIVVVLEKVSLFSVPIPTIPSLFVTPMIGYALWYILDKVYIREIGLSNSEHTMVRSIVIIGTLIWFITQSTLLLEALALA